MKIVLAFNAEKNIHVFFVTDLTLNDSCIMEIILNVEEGRPIQ